MSRIQGICNEVKDHVPEILRDREALTRDQPWLALPTDARLDHIPQLVEALVDACVCAETDRATREHAVRTAMEHGVQRRDHGFEDDLLFREYHLLREAIWRGMQKRRRKDHAAFDAIARIDAGITVATRASLEGFHGRADDEELVRGLVAMGPWPAPEAGA